MNIISIFKLIFSAKWDFNAPQKKDLLIYDGMSIENLYPILKKKNFDIYHVRCEKINLYVLIYTILNNGLLNLKQNYKLNYFKKVKPKAIITLIDDNPGFFRLKKLFPDTKYISIQIALKGDNFFKYLKTFKKKNKNFEFQSDYSFILGKNELLNYSKFLSSKFISLGSLKNNNNPIKFQFKKPITEITFISQFSYSKLNINPKKWRDYKIFQYLKNYCEKKNVKLRLLSRFEGDKKNREKFYREIYGKGNWEFIPNLNVNTTYRVVNSSQFIVFETSTLGYEALSKKIKGVCFPKKFPYKDYSHNYKSSGLFWSQNLNQKILNTKIDQIFKMKNKIWKYQVGNIVNNIVDYNPDNKSLKKIINKII